MPENEIEGLKKRILHSGVPLEIEVTSCLQKQCALITEDLDITMGGYYLDKDENKGRELDIKVFMPIEPAQPPLIFLELLIQCKNIPGNAWIFFKTPQTISAICDRSTSVLDALDWIPRTHVNFTWLEGLHFDRLPLTTAYHEFVMGEKESNKRHDNLFEAIISLAKATSYELETSLQSIREVLKESSLQDLRDYAPDYVSMFYPLSVFNGKMYLADEVHRGMAMTLTPIDHVGLVLNYVSGNYDVDLIIDIVHRSALNRFLKSLVNDANVLKKAANGKLGRDYMKQVSKALKWYAGKKKAKLSDIPVKL